MHCLAKEVFAKLHSVAPLFFFISFYFFIFIFFSAVTIGGDMVLSLFHFLDIFLASSFSFILPSISLV